MVVRLAKTMKTLPDHQAADVDSLSDLGFFNLPRGAGLTLMSMAASFIKVEGSEEFFSRANKYLFRQQHVLQTIIYFMKIQSIYFKNTSVPTPMKIE